MIDSKTITDERYTALTLESEGDKARHSLMSSLTQSDLLKMCYAYKSRVKSEEKLLEKKNRKIEEKPEYTLSSITDVIGVRFVTLFRDDMPKVFERLADIINHNDSLHPNPFLKGHFEEIIIYHTNPYDEVKAKIEEILSAKSIDPIKEYKAHHSKDSYSSIHIVTRINYPSSKLPNNYFIPVEIQIRTVFEDAWGEIDHKYGYVIREGKDTGTPIENPEFVLKHLKILKRFSDACAEYADAIYHEATPSVGLSVDTGRVISVVSDDELINKFREIEVSEHMIAEYQEAREVRKQGQQEVEVNHAKGVTTLLQAAEKFREITEGYLCEQVSPNVRADYLFYYYAKMNEAVSLMSTNKSDQIKAALNIYLELDGKYPDFPLLQLRIAQAYGKLGQPELALEKYEQVHKFIAQFEAKGTVWADNLPEIDYKHIKRSLPTLWGYQLWKKSFSYKDGDIEKISLLQQAYEITSHSLPIDEPERCGKIYNNLVYYSLELADYSSGEDKVTEKILSQLPHNLEKLEGCINIKECEDIEVLDTIAKAYRQVQRKEEACDTLDRIIFLTLGGSKNSVYDHDVMLEIAQEAYTMRQEYMKAGM